MQSDVDEERTRKTEVRTVPLPDSMRTEDVDLRSLISHSVAVQRGDTTESVFTRFAKSQTEFMAVLDGERLVGICSRHRLSELLGGRYGFALWARKPIGMHLSPHETRVSVKTPIENVLRRVFARTNDAFYDDVLLVDERESFLGLITTQTLFKSKTHCCAQPSAPWWIRNTKSAVRTSRWKLTCEWRWSSSRH